MSSYASKCKAMILAAGKGTRLRPLTEDMPKPLVTIAGVPILGFAWANIRNQNGITEVFVNCHHASHRFKKFSTQFPDTGMRFSYETELLGTGGGIAKVRDWLAKDEHLLVQSGDVIADFDYKALMAQHFESKNVATIFTVPKVEGETRITVEGRVLKSLTDSENGEHTFANGYVLSPEFLAAMPAKESSVIETFRHFLSDRPGSIGAMDHSSIWMNLNDKEAFYAAEKEIHASPEVQRPLSWDFVCKQFESWVG